jgi:hypothetical protein
MAPEPELPDYRADQFDLVDPPECDAIMKGGITSGIVYPYAVLEIATRYRFRSIGGTSAGAIAAAFAAAAEYGRSQGRPEAFLTLKRYCDQLPGILASLFQPSPKLQPSFDRARDLAAPGGVQPLLIRLALGCVPWGLVGAAALALPSWLLGATLYAVILAALLGGLIGFSTAVCVTARRRYVRPLTALLHDLPANDFGFCTGLTQPGSDGPALTDWIHHALQDIAFGDPDHPAPLTFGNLDGPDPAQPRIHLRMVTTNLSMRRPHTLPRLGVPAGFSPERWARLFPAPVMAHLVATSKDWGPEESAGYRTFPQAADLPVLVAVRMSLSFPLLFTAVPLAIEDTELFSVVRRLGGTPARHVRTVYFSDGGISSNFPIHMFDSLLPTRPTFAFSLEQLLWDEDKVKRRVILPSDASQGMGVQIATIGDLKAFGWQVLNSAKDWQDQLLSEISGQRERIARIYLTDKEGGLNFNMRPALSRRLMAWGYEAGRMFASGDFDFDEHKWRRLLVLYKNLSGALDQVDEVWANGFADWYAGYLHETGSYNALTVRNKERLARDLSALTAIWAAIEQEPGHERMIERMPGKSGMLRTVPRY